MTKVIAVCRAPTFNTQLCHHKCNERSNTFSLPCCHVWLRILPCHFWIFWVSKTRRFLTAPMKSGVRAFCWTQVGPRDTTATGTLTWSENQYHIWLHVHVVQLPVCGTAPTRSASGTGLRLGDAYHIGTLTLTWSENQYHVW